MFSPPASVDQLFFSFIAILNGTLARGEGGGGGGGGGRNELDF